MIIRGTAAVLVLVLFVQVEAAATSVVTAATRTVDRHKQTHNDYNSRTQHEAVHSQQQGTISIRTPTGGIAQPLLPHHALLERRRRDLHSLGLSDAEAEAELTTLRHEIRAIDRPHEYPRKRIPVTGFDDGVGRSLADIEHQQIGALYQGYGTHYVDVWVGTPPQRQTVIVDTGSGVTAFPCSACNNCGESYHTDSYFIEADSSTFKKLNCDSPCFRGRCSGSGSSQICKISMSYQEGSSWSAYEATDFAYAGGPHDDPLLDAQTGDGLDPKHASNFAFPLTFGCQTSLTGLFRTQLADGIMGMDNANAAFWHQMYDHKAVPERKFSLCFNRQPIASRDGTMAGAVTLGGEDPRLHSSPMVYSDNTRNSGFYTVRLKKMYIRKGGGESAYIGFDDDKDRIRPIDIDEATLNSGGVIVDSGTTDTYMTRRLAEPFTKLWEDVAGRRYTHDAISLTDEQLRSLPTILFQLEGSKENDNMPADFDGTGLAEKLDPSNPKDVLIAMPASHYMEFDPEKETYVSRLYLEEGSGSVLGANAMMGHDVLFDIDNNRVGWAESDCDYFSLIGIETPKLDHGSDKVDSEKLAEEGFEDVMPGEGDGTATGSEIAKKDYIVEAEDFVERVCPSKGCKIGIGVGLIAVIVVFVAYSRYRSSKYGIEYALEENIDLDLQEEQSSGYEDPPGSSGYHDSVRGGETELTPTDGFKYRDDNDDDDDDEIEGRSEFSIT